MRQKPNALTEFKEAISGEQVICANLSRGLWSQVLKKISFIKIPLRIGYSPENYNEFLSRLNFAYDTNCHECINGLIWLTEDSWIEVTTDDDGYLLNTSARWQKRTKPAIPKELL